MELTIGPAPTNWGKKKLMSFYETVSSLPDVKRVLVGEIACPKREIMDVNFFTELKDLLEGRGKEVVLATYVLPTNQKYLDKTLELMEVASQIEVNNYGVLNLWRKNFPNKPVSLGPFSNVYNADSACYLQGLGVKRLTLPVDLELESIPGLRDSFNGTLEVIFYGHLPCAFSWRCYTARFFDRLTRECDFKCYHVPHFFLLSLDDKLAWMVNGPVVYSGQIYFLGRYLTKLLEMGVNSFRLEPTENMVSAVEIISSLFEKRISVEEAENKLKESAPFGLDTQYCVGKEKYKSGVSLLLS